MEKKWNKNKIGRITLLFMAMAAVVALPHPKGAFAEEVVEDDSQTGKPGPISPPAESFTTEDGNFTFTFTGDATDLKNGFVANVTSYLPSAISSDGTLTIPGEIDYHVEGEMVDDKEYVRKVKVAGILKDVFKGNTSLQKLILPETLTYIGQEAFCDCVNLNTIGTSSSTATNTGYLTASEIEYRAFYGCTSLPGITLGERSETDRGVPLGGVQRVQKEAFMNCTSLSSLEIGPTVEWIEGGAFANSNALNGLANSVKVRDNQLFFVQNGILYYKQSDRSNVLLFCPSATEAGDLTSFPENLTEIKNAAFYGCVGLTSIELPDTVQVLGDEAFNGCTYLGNVKIPDSVTKIGTDLFKNCGANVCIICESGSEAERYANSNNVKKSVRCVVTFLNTYNGETEIMEIMSGQTLDPPTGWGRDGYTLRWSDGFTPNTTVINESRTIRTVYVPLYTVTFRDSFTGYESVVTDVEEGTEAAAPEWTRKGYRLTWSTEAFHRVNADMVVNAVWLVSLTDDIQPDDESQYQTGDFITINNVVYKITNYDSRKVRVMGLEDESVSKVTIPANVTFGGRVYRVTSIQAKAFKDNTDITSVTIGGNVTAIGKYSFYRCTSLKKIVINSKVLNTFGYYAFKRTSSKAKVYVPTNALVKTYRAELLDAGLNTKATVKKKN